MVDSLSKLRALPDHTRVWCAHEYTLSNLRFAVTVDAENADLQKRYQDVKAQRDKLEPTVPSILGVEKLTNPFLRWNEPSLQATAKSKDKIQTFARIRGMKDNF
jgi:hydroxyacylglutathione hydrolase